MTATVTVIHPAPGSSVWTAEADLEDGTSVLFAGDWRPMAQLFEAFVAGEPVQVDLEPWQILKVRS